MVMHRSILSDWGRHHDHQPPRRHPWESHGRSPRLSAALVGRGHIDGHGPGGLAARTGPRYQGLSGLGLPIPNGPLVETVGCEFIPAPAGRARRGARGSEQHGGTCVPGVTSDSCKSIAVRALIFQPGFPVVRGSDPDHTVLPPPARGPAGGSGQGGREGHGRRAGAPRTDRGQRRPPHGRFRKVRRRAALKIPSAAGRARSGPSPWRGP
jgi:hypothetical protein